MKHKGHQQLQTETLYKITLATSLQHFVIISLAYSKYFRFSVRYSTAAGLNPNLPANKFGVNSDHSVIAESDELF